MEMQRQLCWSRVIAAAEKLHTSFPQHFRASLLAGRTCMHIILSFVVRIRAFTDDHRWRTDMHGGNAASRAALAVRRS